MSEAEIREGLAAIAEAAAREHKPAPVREDIDLLVLERLPYGA